MTKDSRLVPLVMIPRFTTYAGRAGPAQCFSTIGLDVSEYERATINVWRANVVGCESPAFRLWFEESTDQDRWMPCEGAPSGTEGFDPGDDQEQQVVLDLRRRWFRMRIALGGRDNVVTCWAVGYLLERGAGSAPAPKGRAGSILPGLFRRNRP